jgi:tRNA(adenine34) deaminase
MSRWFAWQAAHPHAPLTPPEPSPIDLAAMLRALQLARDAAAMNEVPVGAVIYHPDSGEILAEAHNRRECDHDPAAHAELLAIRAAASRRGDWRLEHCALAVTLEPCVMCAGLIVNARIPRVVYGAPDPKAGACHSLYRVLEDPRLNHRPQVIRGVNAAESAQLLRDFFRALRSRPTTLPIK